MRSIDFEYDGKKLSDYKFIVCNFNYSSGALTVNSGSKITFNTVPLYSGKKHYLTGTKYEERIQASFDICKNPDIFDDLEISSQEYRELTRWLNRNEFLRFRAIDENKGNDASVCYFDAAFNIDKIKINEVLYGLSLSMETDSPFAYGEEQIHEMDFDGSISKEIEDISDEIGCIYPNLAIECKAEGDLTVTNKLSDGTKLCTMLIKGCTFGEIITIDGNILNISTSLSRNIQDDFNYDFLAIGNNIKTRINTIEASLPCKITLSYFPTVKETP